MTDPMARYHRQMLLPFIGEGGQHRLRASRAVVIGCGALGGAIADVLARAGVGGLTIVDRDIVELSNLQRQTLFDERDVAEGMPKAEAAKRRLNQINHAVDIRAMVCDFDAGSAMECIDGADILLDGLDNFETRYLLNDLAVREHLPLVHGGAVSTVGSSMMIMPHPRCARRDAAAVERWPVEHATPCLRCVFPEPPAAGSTPTCDTVGVLGSLVMMVASLQATQAIKYLVGAFESLDRTLTSLDLMDGAWRRIRMPQIGDDASCPCCGKGSFAYLDGARSGGAAVLCGRGTIQVSPGGGRAARRIDLQALADRLAGHGAFEANRFLLRGTLRDEVDGDGASIGLTIFPDGRALVSGSIDAGRARIVYDRYVGR